MKIIVRTPTGKTLNLEVENCNSIEDVKEKIEDMEGIPAVCQRLGFYGIQLLNGRTLADYNIDDEDTLDMFLRIGGPPGVRVETPGGKTIVLRCESTDIRDKNGLVFAGKDIEDGRAFAHFNFPKGSTLHLELQVKMMCEQSPQDNQSKLQTQLDVENYETKLKGCALHQAKATEVLKELMSVHQAGSSSSESEDLMPAWCKEKKELEAIVSKLTYKNKVVSARCASYETQIAALEAENKKIKLQHIQDLEKFPSTEQGQAFLQDEKAKWLKSVEILNHLTDGALQYFEYGFDSCQKQAEQQGFVGKLDKDAALQEAPVLTGCELSNGQL